MIDLIKVGAHYAVSSVFEEYGEETGIYSYRAFREDFQILHAGQMRLAVRQDIHPLVHHPQSGPDQLLQPVLRRPCLELRSPFLSR